MEDMPHLLDYVITYSKTVEEHISHVNWILSCFSEAGVTVKSKKCFFFQQKVQYTGNMIKLEIGRTKTESLRNAKPPTTKTQPRSFLGLSNVYWRFTRDFAEIDHPLNVLLEKGATDKLELNVEQLESFKSSSSVSFHHHS